MATATPPYNATPEIPRPREEPTRTSERRQGSQYARGGTVGNAIWIEAA
ncbi:hypothetical protein [Cupriavidus basilensis]